MKLTDIQYNKLKDLLNSAKLSNPKEYEELKDAFGFIPLIVFYVCPQYEVLSSKLCILFLFIYFYGHMTLLIT